MLVFFRMYGNQQVEMLSAEQVDAGPVKLAMLKRENLGYPDAFRGHLLDAEIRLIEGQDNRFLEERCIDENLFEFLLFLERKLVVKDDSLQPVMIAYPGYPG